MVWLLEKGWLLSRLNFAMAFPIRFLKSRRKMRLCVCVAF
jgi:hypothetical protein